MRVYRLHMNGDFADAHSAAVWFTRKSDEPAVRRALMEACQDEGMPAPYIEEFKIPTDKVGLVNFLNRFCNR